MTDFDPTYGYHLEQLLNITPPQPPDGFEAFWQSRYTSVSILDPRLQLRPSDTDHKDFEVYDIRYQSSGGIEIGGWLLVPKNMPVKCGVVVGHGYGGRDEPDFNLPIQDAVFMFPCFRGLSRSRCLTISDDPNCHVLHNIENREDYVLGGCVDDLWLAVSALLSLFPEVAGHIAYLGTSFGGGVGALALPWDSRIQCAHFNVPSFGNQPLRLQLPTWGSAAAIQAYQREHCHILATLSYYDAAVAAQYVQVPVHVAAALLDPVVAPPSQFSIYNALPHTKALFVLEKGHADYANKAIEEHRLMSELQVFFHDL
jgi:cephalosporin-C deacetylase